MSDIIYTSRECGGHLIPSGDQIKLKKGTPVKITQSLGGDFTLYVNGNLIKISGKDADAIGQKIIEETNETVNEKYNEKLKKASEKAPVPKNKIVPIKTSTTEEVIHEDDMKGMSVKSGHKRPTKSGAGMTAKGVAAYRRRNPGSKLKTAVTGKVKKGSKDAKRRKSYCARSAGQMKKFPKAAKDPNSRLRQARRRWKC